MNKNELIGSRLMYVQKDSDVASDRKHKWE